MKRLFCLGVFLFAGMRLFGDDTALNPGGWGPQPLNVPAGEESPIQMVSEELVFRYGIEKTGVVATFHFLNTTGNLIHQTIGFPDDGEAAKWAHTPGDETDYGPPLENMRSIVNGTEVPSKLEYGYVQVTGSGWAPGVKGKGQPMAWYTLVVDFPPQKEVIVQRSYDAENGGRNDGWNFFDYTVITGAAWKGNIGHLQARVILQDGLRINDLGWNSVSDDDLVMRPKRAEWKTVSSHEIYLEWTNFKPSKDPDKQEIQIASADAASMRIERIVELVAQLLTACMVIAFLNFARRLIQGRPIRLVLFLYYLAELLTAPLLYLLNGVLAEYSTTFYFAGLLFATLLPAGLILGAKSFRSRRDLAADQVQT